MEQRWKEEAERIAREKVEPNKERAEEIKNIGNKFYAGKQYEEALAYYLKALSYDPHHVLPSTLRKFSTATSPPAAWSSSSSKGHLLTASRPG